MISCDPSSVPRWQSHAVRRCAPPSQTCGPTTSASWARSHGTLNCRTSTATGSQSTPALANPSPRTTRDLRPRNRWSPPLQKESTCTLGLSFLSPSSSSMWFIGPYTCDYLEMMSLILLFTPLTSLLHWLHTKYIIGSQPHKMIAEKKINYRYDYLHIYLLLYLPKTDIIASCIDKLY